MDFSVFKCSKSNVSKIKKATNVVKIVNNLKEGCHIEEERRLSSSANSVKRSDGTSKKQRDDANLDISKKVTFDLFGINNVWVHSTYLCNEMKGYNMI